MSKVIVDIRGLTPIFNWIAELVTKYLVGRYEEIITDFIETDLKSNIQEFLDTIIIPGVPDPISTQFEYVY